MMVIYPWMPKELNPNCREHWTKKAVKFKQYKNTCWTLTMQGYPKKPTEDRVHLAITFYKPTRARRDLDNLLAAFKAGIDGISLALGVDDSNFLLSIDMAEEIGSYVKVEFNYR